MSGMILLCSLVLQKEEETARRRKEMMGKTPIRLPPMRVGGPRVSHEDAITQQQRQTDKSITQKSIEMRVHNNVKSNIYLPLLPCTHHLPCNFII